MSQRVVVTAREFQRVMMSIWAALGSDSNIMLRAKKDEIQDWINRMGCPGRRAFLLIRVLHYLEDVCGDEEEYPLENVRRDEDECPLPKRVRLTAPEPPDEPCAE
jgi:hypothetical protein